MQATQLSQSHNGFSAPPLHGLPLEAGRQCQGKLWSNLNEIGNLLRIPMSTSSADNEILFQHVQFKAGQRVHIIGQEFDTFYIVNSGFLKTVSIDEFGNQQVLSFPMKGDMLGVDSIHTRKYASEAVALTDCNLILVPFKKLAALARVHAELEHAIYDAISRELTRKQAMVNMLGALSAEARVAWFLVSISDKFAEIGYSRSIFNLRMTRQEIGSYLGLSLETVSRTLSALNNIGLIGVEQREIQIKEHDRLRTLRRIPSSKSITKSSVFRKAAAVGTHVH